MKFSLMLGAFFVTSTASFAQNMLGISTSRQGGTNRLYINPALAADVQNRVYLNGFVANLHVDNNYVRYQAPFSLLGLITGTVPDQYRRPDGSVRFESDYTSENLDGRPKNGTLWGEVRGPSLLVKTNEGSAFAVTTRFRAIGQLTGASQSLLSAIRAGLEDGALYGIPSSNNQFSVNTSTYSEVGLTYAGTLLEADGRRLLLGATAKVLLGYNAQSLINRGLDYRVIADPDQPNSAILEVNRLDATLSYTTFLQNRTLTPSTLLSPSSPGRGFGLDLGLTYISQYDADSPAWQIGLALTDIGSIRYKGEQYDYASVQQQPVQFRSSDFNNTAGTLQIARIIQDKFNTGRSPDQNQFRTGLPTSLNLTWDYQSPLGAGLNITYFQDVRSAGAQSVHQPSLLAITPRYDTRLVSVALPMLYLNRGLMVGASLRVGPAWLGTDNFLGLVGNGSNGIRPRGLDVYGGIAFGIGRTDED
ncbi:hypothetical protein GGR92_000400 [Spirosoma lacussanchae]|uniref:DUF5723 family protein n=1 Tax=Spirosoma lacussanchae TaxID=1884249 RepID=UPI001109863D|nr:DUF5723 family protein [Spirosoma lacussanchae]